MSSFQTVSSSQPWIKAVSLILGDGNAIQWEDCRLIWDPTNLVDADAKDSEVRAPIYESHLSC